VVASAEAPAELPAAQAASQRSSQAWAMLIKRVCLKKGSGTNYAQHPSGRSGNWYLTRMALNPLKTL